MTKYRIEIDRERCIGDGLCHEGADGTFHIDDEHRCAVKDLKGNSPEDILFAAWNCANSCISLYDQETGEKLWPAHLSREEFDELARRKLETMDPDEWAFWRDLGEGG